MRKKFIAVFAFVSVLTERELMKASISSVISSSHMLTLAFYVHAQLSSIAVLSTNNGQMSCLEKSASSRNLWISGLASTTRATDLKTVFSKYGKVIA